MPGENLELIRRGHEAFSRGDLSLEEVLREEAEVSVIVERLWGRGRGSGAEAKMRVFSVYRSNAEGKVTRRQAFTSREAALEAVEG